MYLLNSIKRSFMCSQFQVFCYCTRYKKLVKKMCCDCLARTLRVVDLVGMVMKPIKNAFNLLLILPCI